MKKTYEFKAKVETIREGQIARYDDSVYEYIITSESDPSTVKRFCRTFIHPARLSKKEWDESQSPSDHFAGYYIFDCLGNNQYRYFVFEPYCD